MGPSPRPKIHRIYSHHKLENNPVATAALSTGNLEAQTPGSKPPRLTVRTRHVSKVPFLSLFVSIALGVALLNHRIAMMPNRATILVSARIIASRDYYRATVRVRG